MKNKEHVLEEHRLPVQLHYLPYSDTRVLRLRREEIVNCKIFFAQQNSTLFNFIGVTRKAFFFTMQTFCEFYQ